MVSNCNSVSFLFCVLVLVLSTLIPRVTAQLGCNVTVPAYNATVKAGEKLEIQFEYQNMGSGSYNIDIDLYQDGGMTQHIMSVVQDYDVPDGTSIGVQLPLVMNGNYTWNVPHGIKVPAGNGTNITMDIFYLTVTANITTPYYSYLRLRSRPILLHYSGGVIHVPAPLMVVFAIIASVLLLF